MGHPNQDFSEMKDDVVGHQRNGFLLALTILKLSRSIKREAVYTFPSFRFPEYKSAHLKLASPYIYATQPFRG